MGRMNAKLIENIEIIVPRIEKEQKKRRKGEKIVGYNIV